MKEPHNHRKVGYSMIVISVSLTLIGLLVWVIGNNYHYSTDLMSGQEIDAMTPKNGYNIISFDDSQPVGAKLKLLDHSTTNETALQLQEKYTVSGFTILIFNPSIDHNKNLVDTQKTLDEQIAQEKAAAAAATAKANAAVKNATQETSIGTSNSTVVITNQTNGSNKSVNLSENVGIASK
jgi:hypothetical protein